MSENETEGAVVYLVLREHRALSARAATRAA